MDGGRIAPHDRARVSRIGGRGGTLPRRHPERLVETITLCPDPANSCPSFLSPCFLGSVTWLCSSSLGIQQQIKLVSRPRITLNRNE